MTKARIAGVVVSGFLVCAALLAHEHAQKKAGGQSGNEAVFNQTTQAMASRQVDMGPHMKMTRARRMRAGDAQRADEITQAARTALEKYRDHKAAEADGYEVFLPQFPQKMYHFTNYRYAFESAFVFNPSKPTSLLYERSGDGYKLVGAMYTAPKDMSEPELDERIPLSVAQWHAHVNLCLPPRQRRKEALGKNPRFGLQGSIATREACEKEGGFFVPQVFGWMVHMYPFEATREKVWSLDPQKPQAHSHSH
ncbi:MAG: hypothetical protein L0099_01165 [Acidobacteria bacterium]|nr:hypothetical protein [Acidobacteriota bacterium]